MRSGIVGLLGLVFVQGCSSSYEPARSPRIETVVDGGYPTFVKDGAHFGSPALGTGLVDAVRGNPRAEHHARVGRNLIVGGFVLDLVGLGTEIGGLVVLAHDQTGQSDAPASGLAVGLVVGGLVAVATGTVMIMSGQPHVYDAINIYNDGLSTQPTPAPSPLGPRLQ
ncbi:MAG: hypothetical protein WDO69_16470 [Pseudomonadota bacterium]